MRDGDHLGLDRISRAARAARPAAGPAAARLPCRRDQRQGIDLRLPPRRRWRRRAQRVHAFTSPHLVRYNERIRIAGKLIDDALLAELMSRVLDANDEIGASLFEVNTAVAFLAFAETPADACILEVGLGGRLDATNVIERPLVTRHRQPRPRSPGVPRQPHDRRRGGEGRASPSAACRSSPSFTRPRSPSRIGEVAHEVGRHLGAARAALGRDRPAAASCAIATAQGELDLPLPRLPGKHQAMNAALAVAMLRHQSALDVPPSALSAAMGWADWPARLQQLTAGPLFDMLPRGSELWVDGGHNPSAARLVADHARRNWNDGLPLVLLFASLASKDAAGVLRPFEGIADEVLTLPIDGHECRTPEELAALADEHGPCHAQRTTQPGRRHDGAAASRPACWCSARSTSPAKLLALNGRCRTRLVRPGRRLRRPCPPCRSSCRPVRSASSARTG